MGKQAAPDKLHNLVRIWEERIAYERRYNVADAKRIHATDRITLMMRCIAGITSIRV